jgi:transcriptional regulator with XRE-family HTH domain
MKAKPPVSPETTKRLVHARMAKGLSQRQAANLYQVSVGHLSKVEAGISPVTPQMAALAAARLGVRIEWLLVGSGAMEAAHESAVPPQDDEIIEAAISLLSGDHDLDNLRKAAELAGCDFRNMVRFKLKEEIAKRKGVSP